MGWEYRLFWRPSTGGASPRVLSEMQCDGGVEQPEQRSDIYLPHAADVGIKRRGGSDLELKVREKISSETGAEKWKKHKDGGEKLKGLLAGRPLPSLPEVKIVKRRWIYSKPGECLMEETELVVEITFPGVSAPPLTERWMTAAVEGSLKVASVVQAQQSLLASVKAASSPTSPYYNIGYAEFVVARATAALQQSASSLAQPALPPPVLLPASSPPLRPPFFFGKFPLLESQIFFESLLSLAITNVCPTVPGHVLVVPKRVTGRLSSLSTAEVLDLFSAVSVVGPVVERHFAGTALTVTVQDGKAAGQTVPHVHVHVLPRREGDFRRNDDVYEKIHDMGLEEQWHAHTYPTPDTLPLKKRTSEEMAAEATALRALFR